MNPARADALFARRQLDALGWNLRAEDDFRHITPPGPAPWLATDAASTACAAPACEGSGWALSLAGPPSSAAAVDARWLDAADPAQRTELLAGIAAPPAQGAAPLGWAHRAMLRHGLRLQVGRTQGEPARLRLDHRPRRVVEAPLLVLELAPGAHAVLIECHERDPAACEQAVAQNLQIHVHLGAGAVLEHVRIVRPGPTDRLAHQLSVRLAAKARYQLALLADASDYHLQRARIELQGSGARARCASVLLGEHGALDHQLHALHRAPHTHSLAHALALGRDDARVVLNAFARIEAGGRDASVQQQLRGVPTHGRPRLILRPHLEILHDQVQARHGASCGPLPRDALFYAVQRGIAPARARALLLEGMARRLFAPAMADVVIESVLEPRLASAIAAHLRADDRAPVGAQATASNAPEPEHA